MIEPRRLLPALLFLACVACGPSGGGQAQTKVGKAPADPAARGIASASSAADPLARNGWTVQRADAEGLTALHNDGAFIELQLVDLRRAQIDALSSEEVHGSVLSVLTSRYGDVCPGLEDAAPKPIARGTEKTVSGRYVCSAMTNEQDNWIVAMFASELPTAKKDARVLALTYGNKLLAQEPLGLTVSEAIETAPLTSTQTTTAQGAKSFTDAIRRVPNNKRPVGVAYVGGWDSVAMSIQYEPWFLLPDGTASPAECLFASDCERTSWRKTGGGVSLANYAKVLDGEGDLRPFKPGERVSISLGNVGSGNFGTGGGQVSYGALEMTTDGRIAVSEDIANNIYGNGFSASASSSGAMTGTYHLDGFLMAIDDGAGNIGVGTIIRKYEGRDLFIYLNGELYWEE
jgi:hypothetical protein